MVGNGVFHGIRGMQREYVTGWTIGHDDGSDGEAFDLALGGSRTAFSDGYRDGYRTARFVAPAEEVQGG